VFPSRKEKEVLKDTIMDGELVLDIDKTKVGSVQLINIQVFNYYIRKHGDILYLT
jgi:hypothetical protein